MKQIILIICIIISVNNKAQCQGVYLNENEIFDYVEKNEIAKKHKIKSIKEYPDYKIEESKGNCKKEDVYDSNGNIIKETMYPNTKEEYVKHAFIYNENRLVEIREFYKDEDEPNHYYFINYNTKNQITSITSQHKNEVNNATVINYFYTEDGKFDYSQRVGATFKNKIHYNKCGRIEYVESLSITEESIKLDSNDCIIYYEPFHEYEYKEGEEDYVKRIMNNNCETKTYFSRRRRYKYWIIQTQENTYNESGQFIEAVYSKRKARLNMTYFKKYERYYHTEYEYNDKGLQTSAKFFNLKNELDRNYYTEYNYY